MYSRTNRSKSPFSWRGESEVKILADEKLVAFRMSKRRYEALKVIAAKAQKPVAQLINEVLEQKLKLEHNALRIESKKK